jgi:hypothetical protein
MCKTLAVCQQVAYNREKKKGGDNMARTSSVYETYEFRVGTIIVKLYRLERTDQKYCTDYKYLADICRLFFIGYK